MGGNSVITPYLNYDYVDAKLKSFTETGGNGAELTVDNNHSRHSFLTGGVKWATQMGGVVPEVNLGYRYRFGNSRSRSTMRSRRIRRTTSTSSRRARSAARSSRASVLAASLVRST